MSHDLRAEGGGPFRRKPRSSAKEVDLGNLGPPYRKGFLLYVLDIVAACIIIAGFVSVALAFMAASGSSAGPAARYTAGDSPMLFWTGVACIISGIWTLVVIQVADAVLEIRATVLRAVAKSSGMSAG